LIDPRANSAGTPPARHLPWSSVVGQEDAKLALLLAAVDPKLGGVLLRGDKGSAKTTLARGLAALLDDGARFVELPLGATEDRVVGSIDVAALLGDRTQVFRPGLLADADGGVLYVDEINLLADHLVDTLLDVAVSGVNRVEKDGLSEIHPARFVLVGSMNPEEGELRPQLLDRFGLTVEVRATADPAERAEIVRRQLYFDASARADPVAVEADRELRTALRRASPARLHPATVDAAARLALAVGAEGLRADLSLCRAAAALAGWEARAEAVPEDLRRIAGLVLAHRRRRHPFEAPGLASDELDDALDQTLGQAPVAPAPVEGAAGDAAPGGTPGAGRRSEPTAPGQGGDRGSDAAQGEAGDGGGFGDGGDLGAGGAQERGGDLRSDAVAEERGGGADARETLPPGIDLRPPERPRRPDAARRRAAPGRGERGGATRGQAVGSTTWEGSELRLAVAPTAIAYGRRRARHPDEDLPADDPEAEDPRVEELRVEDLRAVVAEQSRATLVILAVDASGSMAARDRLAAARAAVLGLLSDAYRRRDRVALIVFRGATADVVLRPTASVEIARNRLTDLPTGGTTPLAAGLRAVTEMARSAVRAGGPDPVAVLITDGRATAGGDDPLAAAQQAAHELAATGTPCLVLDAETGPTRLGLARALAATLGAEHVDLATLERDGAVEAAIRQRVAGAERRP
jgi:magnesium chelatase subunit D